jgi:CheY-like chemotaxis protein
VMVMQLGYQVLSAQNGIDAIAMLQGNEFDLLFSDVRMPGGMNGVELAREAKRLNRGIKVLLTTGYADDVSTRCEALDEFPIIGKPFLKADLARCLWSVLQGT